MGGRLRHGSVRPEPASTGNRRLYAGPGIEIDKMVWGQQGTNASFASHARGPRDANGRPFREDYLRILRLDTQAGVCIPVKSLLRRSSNHSQIDPYREFGSPVPGPCCLPEDYFGMRRYRRAGWDPRLRVSGPGSPRTCRPTSVLDHLR